MKKDMFDLIFKWVAVAVMGAQAITFVTSKTDAVKFDPTPLERNLAENKTDIAVQKTEISTLKNNIIEIKKDIKEIKDLFYQELGYNRPAKPQK